MLPEFPNGVLKCQGSSVGSIGRHRVHRIGDHDDPCPERDLVSNQSVGVAGTIVVLMMMLDGLNDCTLELGDRAQELGAPHNMSLHHNSLLRRQLRLFAKERGKRSEEHTSELQSPMY